MIEKQLHINYFHRLQKNVKVYIYLVMLVAVNQC